MGNHHRLPDDVPRKRPGRKMSEYRLALEQFPCSTCKAEPGQACNRVPSHAPRVHALEEHEIAQLRGER